MIREVTSFRVLAVLPGAGTPAVAKKAPHENRSQNLSELDIYKSLVGIVVPRPIAWISTIDSRGIVDLAPFSAGRWSAAANMGRGRVPKADVREVQCTDSASAALPVWIIVFSEMNWPGFSPGETKGSF